MKIRYQRFATYAAAEEAAKAFASKYEIIAELDYFIVKVIARLGGPV